MSEFINIKQFKVNPFPESEKEEILQNVAIIILTPKFSVPLYRGFGLAGRFLDKSIAVAKTILTTEVLEAVEKYEPRAEIVSINFDINEKTGLLNPVVEVDIKNE